MPGLLTFTSKGIYCEQGNFFIDPWKPVDNALITHGHADHSRYGSTTYLTHRDSLPIIQHRLGNVNIKGVDYNETLIKNGVKVSFHPAGHLLGSAQIRVEHKGEVWVASGDYKTTPDPIAEDFEPVKCHTFITECTFGLPVYNWPDEKQVITAIEEWWKENQVLGKASLLSAYSLGKAQRILALVNEAIGPIYCHGAVSAMNEVFRKSNHLRSSATYLDDSIPKTARSRSLIIAPPSAIGSSWARKLGPISVGTASGWMMLRGSKRRQNVDRGFVFSDHADWAGLNDAIKATEASRIVCTHGYTGVFSQWLNEKGYEALEEKTVFEGELNTEES